MDTTRTIAQCLAGDRLAQRKLYEHFLPYTLTVTRRYGVASRYQADVVQEIFAEVFSKLVTFDPEKGKLSTWLRTIAVRRTVDFQRKHEKLRQTTLAAILPELTPTAPLELDQLPTDELFAAFASLPPGFRTVFNLYAVDGFSHKEIAGMLRITSAGSRSQYARARERLRRHLQSSKKKQLAHELR